VPAYDAFISYSHAKDKPIAAALQSVIQKLGKAWYERRAARVFRDDTSLSATPHLWPSIEKALSESRHLILLASPEAASSPWIAKEIDYWLRHKSSDTLFIGLTAGELAWDNNKGNFKWTVETPLPEVLKERFSSEPKWVDLSAYRDGANPRNAKLIDLGADFAAAIRGMPKEDLMSEEVRQQRRARRLAVGAAASLLILAAAATYQWQRAGWALTAATKGTNTLVAEVAIKFRDIAGVPIDRIREILDRTLELQTDLASIGGNRTDVKRTEALARRELSTTVRMQGAFGDALRYAETSKAIMEDLVAADPSNMQLRRELSLSLNRVGEALLSTGRKQEALEAFRDSLAIRHELAKTGSLQARRDLALSQERVADALTGLGEADQAAVAYETALTIRQELVASNPTKSEWQLDLAVSHDKRGNLLDASGRINEALSEYAKALAIRSALVRRDPSNLPAQRDLSSSHIRIGGAFLKAGRKQEAARSFREALVIRRGLAQDRSNVNAQIDLVVNLTKIADAGVDPVANLTEANRIVGELESQGKLTADRKAWAVSLKRWLASISPPSLLPPP
jgi:tetratricopeptide (TPR) repeat protein